MLLASAEKCIDASVVSNVNCDWSNDNLELLVLATKQYFTTPFLGGIIPPSYGNVPLC